MKARMTVKCVLCSHKMAGWFVDQPMCEKCGGICVLQKVETSYIKIKQNKNSTKITAKLKDEK